MRTDEQRAAALGRSSSRPAGERRHDPQPRARRPDAVAGPPALGAARPRAEHPERAGRGPRGEPAQHHRAGRRPGRDRLRHPGAATDRPPGHPGVVHRPRRPDGSRVRARPARVRRCCSTGCRTGASTAWCRGWPTCSTGSGTRSPRRRHGHETARVPRAVGPSCSRSRCTAACSAGSPGVPTCHPAASRSATSVPWRCCCGSSSGCQPSSWSWCTCCCPGRRIRLVADVIGIWGLIWMLGLAASYKVHPHVVTESGAADQAGARRRHHGAVGGRRHRRHAGTRSRDTSKALQVDRSEQAVVLNVVMGSMTDVDIRLRRPMLVTGAGQRGVGHRDPAVRRRASAAGRRGTRAPGTGGSAQALVDVAPAPRLAGLEAAHHRVLGLVEVRGRRAAAARSRSSRRARRSGTAAGAPTWSLRAGTPRSPRACSAAPRPAPCEVLAVRPLGRRGAQLAVARSRLVLEPVEQRLLDVERGQDVAAAPRRRRAVVPGARRTTSRSACEHLLAQPAVVLARRLAVAAARRAAPTPRSARPPAASSSWSTTRRVVVVGRRARPAAPARRVVASASSGGLLQRVLGRVGAGQAEPADQPGQRRALDQQGAADDDERGEHAARPGAACPRAAAEGGGQGDHAAHAGPGDQRRRSARLPRPCAAHRGVPNAVGRRRAEHPDERARIVGDQHRGADRATIRPVPSSLSDGVARSSRHLQPDQQEDRVLQQELDRAPVGLLGEPRGRRLQRRRLVPEQQAGDHHGQHAGARAPPRPAR